MGRDFPAWAGLGQNLKKPSPAQPSPWAGPNGPNIIKGEIVEVESTFCEYESSTSLEVSSTDRVRVFESPGIHFKKIFFESDFTKKIANFLSLSDIFLDSFQTP